MRLKLMTGFPLLFIVMMMSIDAGAQTWVTKQVGITNTFVERMSFTSSTVGYASLGDNTGGVGSVLKTTDGGTTWTKINAACTNATYDVKFLDANTGFTCSFNGEIAKTTNSGTNWTRVYTNGSSNYLYTLGCFDANTIFSAGFSYVTRSTNGGSSWTESSLSGFQYSSAVLSSTKAIMCGSNTGSDGGIWTTTNAGASWAYTQISTSNIFYDVAFYDANTGIVVGGSGIAYKTTNGGSSWTSLTTGTTAALQASTFLNANTVLIGGSGGVVYLSTNGGTSWTQASTYPQISGQSNYCIHFFDANNGILSGSQGAFLKTTNGGTTWISIGNNLQLNGIVFTGNTTGYAVGVNSVIQKTTDGGNTWQICTGVNTSATLNCLDFPGVTTGYTAGLNGTLIKTTNSGGTWNTVASGVATSITALKFLDSLTGYYGSTGGVLKKTTDGGSSWSALTTGFSTTINTIAFPSALVGYLGSTGGAIRKTTNGGTSWTALTSGVSTSITSIYFLDESNGYAVGASGTILKTTDGGASWTKQTSGTTQGLNFVRFGDVSAGLAVGNSGTILVTTSGGSTWTAQTSGTTQNLRATVLAGVNNTFVCGGNGTILYNNDQTLPVELTSFTATADQSTITLKWRTATEINCYGFAIERHVQSPDFSASPSWDAIGFVPGNGNSNTPRYYSFVDKRMQGGQYTYRLKKIDLDGSYEYSPAINASLAMKPGVFAVANYPNPFNPETNFQYSIPVASVVNLSLFNMLGQHVATVVNEYKEAGTYQVSFDGSKFSSGMYLYTLQAGKNTITKKMLLLK